MTPRVLVLAGVLCSTTIAVAAERMPVPRLPADVANFKSRRDLCDHFRGEDPYDAERRRFLEENLKKYCTGTDEELSSLKARYGDNEAVLKALAGYEQEIEGDH